MRDYLQVTEEHFDRAAKAAHFAAQHPAATGRDDSHGVFGDLTQVGELPDLAASCGSVKVRTTYISYARQDSNL